MARSLSFGATNVFPKHRSSLKIAADVLSVASVRTRRTRIMYQANLSFQLIEKYLASLLEQGLLMCDTGSSYVVTEKGTKFLQMYFNYVERCKKIGQDIDEALKERTVLENICFNNKLNSKRTTSRKETAT